MTLLLHLLKLGLAIGLSFINETLANVTQMGALKVLSHWIFLLAVLWNPETTMRKACNTYQKMRGQME